MNPRVCTGRDDDAGSCPSSAHYTANDGSRLCARHAIRAAGDGARVTPDDGWPSVHDKEPRFQ